MSMVMTASGGLPGLGGLLRAGEVARLQGLANLPHRAVGAAGTVGPREPCIGLLGGAEIAAVFGRTMRKLAEAL